MNREFIRKNNYAILGIMILGIFAIIAAGAGIFSPHLLNTGLYPFQPPSMTHPLGTNDMGYDILTELFHASRVSMAIGVLAAWISVFIGGTLGILSGYFRGLIGEALTGIIDIFLLIPVLPLMVVLAAYLGQHWWNIVLVISLLGWCSTARAVRSKVLQLRETLFVEALKALGISHRRIVVRHMVPHVFEILSAKFILAVAGAMLSEAALAFIGLGDPSKTSWGMMMHYAFKRGGFVNGMWYWYLPPGLCIGVCTLGFILLGMHLEKKGTQTAGGEDLVL